MKKTNWIRYYLGASVVLMLLATIIFRSALNFTEYTGLSVISRVGD